MLRQIRYGCRPFSSSKANVAKPSPSESWSLQLPRVSNRQVFNQLLPLMWPKNDPKSRIRVVSAISLLLGGKVK